MRRVHGAQLLLGPRRYWRRQLGSVSRRFRARDRRLGHQHATERDDHWRVLMAATTAPTTKAAAYTRPLPVKRSKLPTTMPVAAPAPPPSAHGNGNARGKRPRASDGHMDLEKDRPRRVKSSRGQKRADATGAAVSDVKPADASKSANGSLGQNDGGGGAYRRVMFASFIKQAFDKRAKVRRAPWRSTVKFSAADS